jgi:hypothetical protein
MKENIQKNASSSAVYGLGLIGAAIILFRLLQISG